jgi:hypothetical protein
LPDTLPGGRPAGPDFKQTTTKEKTMNKLNTPRKASVPVFLRHGSTLFKVAGVAVRIAVVVSLATVMVGCVKPPERSHASKRDHLLGWFKLPGRNEKKQVVSGHDTLIPVFKRDGIYYSVCRGFEIPFRECPEGLEWALTPFNMVGTKIGWDAESKTYYLAAMDQTANRISDGRYGCGEKDPMTRIEKPSGLLDAKARRPRTNDDFLGWYQPVWFPWIKTEIQKNGDRNFSARQTLREPGIWKTSAETCELILLPDQLGFGFGRDHITSLVYNETLKRFELVFERVEMTPSVVRMPLARVSAPSSSEGGHAPPPTVAIGIPSWH